MTKYFDGMGKDVTLEVLKWKEAFDSQAAKTPEKICEEPSDEEATVEATIEPSVEKTDKSKKHKR